MRLTRSRRFKSLSRYVMRQCQIFPGGTTHQPFSLKGRKRHHCSYGIHYFAHALVSKTVSSIEILDRDTLLQGFCLTVKYIESSTHEIGRSTHSMGIRSTNWQAGGSHFEVKYLAAERVASLARASGMWPRTTSIMAKCSKFSYVWNRASPVQTPHKAFTAAPQSLFFIYKVSRCHETWFDMLRQEFSLSLSLSLSPPPSLPLSLSLSGQY